MRDIVKEYTGAEGDMPQASKSAAPLEPLQDVSVAGQRNTIFYRAHSYHTKVPPEAIIPFIEHFTSPGDLVLDPFCGSGMTGVATSLTGRRCILNDLSPAAVHLAWNHCHPCDPSELEFQFEKIASSLSEEIATLYGTTHSDGTPAVINWLMWSAKLECPCCKSGFLLWDAIDKKSGRLGTIIDCPRCQETVARRHLKPIGSEPAWMSYRTLDGKLFERAATKDDIEKAKAIKKESISEWFPTNKLGRDREMYVRCALHLREIRDVSDFYTARNLKALSHIWKAIQEVKSKRTRLALMFAFTNTAWHGTRMRRFNARGGQRPLTGTLYIPQLSSEVNVLEVMRNKIRHLTKYYSAYRPSCSPPTVLNRSATDLSCIDDNSIDYVFTDPPFGSNIFYGDCNLIWESWLGRITNVQNEAVVNRSVGPNAGGKTIDDYSYLMSKSMHEISRVLKPGGWATVVFHNTDSSVWTAIQQAAEAGGFEFHEAASLDRKQHSHKGYKGKNGAENVAHFDVIMNLRKPHGLADIEHQQCLSESASLEHLLVDIARVPGIQARGLQGIHAEVMRRQASLGQSTFFSYSEVKQAWQKVDASLGNSTSN